MYSRRPNEVSWDQETVRRVWALAQSDPYILSCTQVLTMYVFGDGVCVEWVKGEQVFECHANFNEHVQRHWEPFAKHVMLNLLMFGVCPYKVTYTASGDAVPIVPTFGTYLITVQPTQDYTLKYRCYRSANQVALGNAAYQEDTEMHVLVLNDMDTAGGIHGPLVTVLTVDAFVNDQMRNTTVANWISSNPTIITTSQQKSDARMEHQMHSAFTTSAQQENQQGERMRARDRHNIDALQKQIEGVRDFNTTQNTIGRDSNTVVEKDSFSQQMQTRQHSKQYEQNCLPLPHGQTITNQVLPRAPHDMMHLIKWKEDTTCSVMGVPKSLFGGGGQGSGNSIGIKNSINMRMLNITVNRWKQQLGQMLEQVYWLVYAQDSLNAIADNHYPTAAATPPPQKKQKTTAGDTSSGPAGVLHSPMDAQSEASDADTEAPLPQQRKRSQVPHVRFLFPFTPSASIEEISYLFDRGAIDQQTEAEYLCKCLGRPLTAITLHESLVDRQLDVTEKAKAVQPNTADNTQYKAPI